MGVLSVVALAVFSPYVGLLGNFHFDFDECRIEVGFPATAAALAVRPPFIFSTSFWPPFPLLEVGMMLEMWRPKEDPRQGP